MSENHSARLIRELPEGEQPFQRLVQEGPEALSLCELLSLCCRTHDLSTPQELLVYFGGVTGLLNAPIAELCQFQGIGPAKAALLKAALELGRRSLSPVERSQIRSPQDAASLFIPLLNHLEQEEFWVVVLNTKNQVLTKRRLYRGTLNSSTIRIAEVFREAIRINGASIVVAHNHPSGTCEPSPEDLRLTKELVVAGEFLDLQVLDHIIVGKGAWLSCKERGWLGVEGLTNG